MVQNTNSPSGDYVKAMTPLFDAMEEYTPHQRNVIKSRFLPMIDATEIKAKRSEWWDTRMFFIGFGTSLAVTILAAINIASFITPMTRDVLGAVVLAVSSIGTAALGLRERLKFHETALIARRLSSKLQRRGFLFLARAEPYDTNNREECYASFIGYTEKIKLQADEEQMKLQAERDDTLHRNQQPQHSSGLVPLSTVTAAAIPPSKNSDINTIAKRKPVDRREALRVNVTDLDLTEGPPPTPF